MKNYGRKNCVLHRWKKRAGEALFGAGVCCLLAGGTSEAAGFLEEVPAGDWSYGAANDLILAGKVPDYEVAIPEGRVLSRLEMAMIVESATQNTAAMSAEQQAETAKLREAYYYDMRKLALLERLDRADETQLQALESGKGAEGEVFTKEDREALKKASALADKFSVGGYARIRNDHYLKDASDGGTERTRRANMIEVKVNSKYKANENWDIHADLTYRNSLSGFDERLRLSPGEDHSGLKLDTYVVGRLAGDALKVKFGKWNEWNVYGWGMDIDCDFAGIQMEYGKKAFKTYFTAGSMDLWDDVMGGARTKEYVTSLRFYYPFDKNNDINFGVSYSSAMESRFQDPDQGRVFYYYAHGRHTFDKNWTMRAGVINSNAKRDPDNPVAGTKTKSPGRWLQLQYKGAKLQDPGSYGITATYRYEPALTWPTVTDWCGLNERFFRLGASYVPAKNILLDTFYTWGREIDTGKRSDMFRFQAQVFF